MNIEHPDTEEKIEYFESEDDLPQEITAHTSTILGMERAGWDVENSKVFLLCVS